MLLIPFDDSVDCTAVPAFGRARTKLGLVEAVGDFPGVESALPQVHDDKERFVLLRMADCLPTLVLEFRRKICCTSCARIFSAASWLRVTTDEKCRSLGEFRSIELA
jgi:hypothetical protein